MSESLRGKLLIAAPQLLDYFRRTVLLVVEHTEEGAMGVVLNRPTEREVATAHGDLWPAVLQRKGGAYLLLASMPADPTLN